MFRRTVAVAGLAAVGAISAGLATQASGSGMNESTFGAAPGGFAAYHGTYLTKDPKTPLANEAVHYSGP